jgi:hypothetical protein
MASKKLKMNFKISDTELKLTDFENLVNKIEDNRMQNIDFLNNKIEPNSPQWFYIKGNIDSLTDILYYYYSGLK